MAAERFDLFVYGSLKRGFRHHALLQRAVFESETETIAGYHLVLLGDYPGLVDGGDESVQGERYSVDAELLSLLDEFEGPEYERRNVRLMSGEPAQAYFVSGSAGTLARFPGRSWNRD